MVSVKLEHRCIGGGLGDWTKLTTGCLGKWPKTQEGKYQGGTSMGSWQGRSLEGSDTTASIWEGQSPGWALALIHAVWPAFLLNPILNYLCCVPAPGKDWGFEPGLVEGTRIEDTEQAFQGIHECGVPVKAENMEEYWGEKKEPQKQQAAKILYLNTERCKYTGRTEHPQKWLCLFKVTLQWFFGCHLATLLSIDIPQSPSQMLLGEGAVLQTWIKCKVSIATRKKLWVFLHHYSCQEVFSTCRLLRKQIQ